MKRVLITGITGQDGPYLAKYLLDKDYMVFGGYRASSEKGFNNLKRLGIFGHRNLRLVPFEISEFESVARAIQEANPSEIYNFAAQSHVKLSFDFPITTSKITGLGVLNILEFIRQVNPSIKLYQASTSELFGGMQGKDAVFNEESKFNPRSPYATAKLFAHHMVKNYREAYGLFACCGIMFNHESPIRGLDFVTRKVTYHAAWIAEAASNHRKVSPLFLVLGNTEASRDWGFAGDYVKAAHLMLQQDKPDDYVISTGENHTVRELVEIAFDTVGLKGEWRGEGENSEFYCLENGKLLAATRKELFRPSDCWHLTGDSSKARKVLGWSPTVSFREMIETMTHSDYEFIKRMNE